jgi:hypothetical protein
VGKGYFLIGDGVADLIFGHRWLRSVGKLCEVAREKLRAEVPELWEAGRECIKKSRRGEMLGLSDF